MNNEEQALRDIASTGKFTYKGQQITRADVAHVNGSPIADPLIAMPARVTMLFAARVAHRFGRLGRIQ